MFKRRQKAKTNSDPSVAADKSKNTAKSSKIGIGIRAKLQTAFVAVALMTVIAVGVAIVAFSSTEREFKHVAGHDVPMMTDALRLSVLSGEMSAAAARFVSARTADQQHTIADLLEARSRDLSTIMERLRATQQGNASFTAVQNAAQRLDKNLAALKKAIVDRADLRAKLESRLAGVHQVHGRISDKLMPIVDDTYFEVVSAAEDIGKVGNRSIRSFVNGGLERLQTIVNIGSEMNMATGLLTAGSVASSPGMLGFLEERYKISAQRAKNLLSKLPNEPEFSPLRQQIAVLLRLSDFKNGNGAENDNTERLKNIFRAHESMAGILIKLVDDLNFQLTMGGEDTIKKSSGLLNTLANTQIAGLRNALETAAQTHLLSSLISEGATVQEPARLVPIQDRFKAAVDLLKRASRTLKQPEITKMIDSLITFGSGSDGVFALRGRELQADQIANQAVADNAAIQGDLDKAVAGLVAAAENSMKHSETQLVESLSQNRNMLLLVAFVSVLAAAGIGVFYVHRKLVKPLTAIDHSMRQLSSGETELVLPKVRANDEIASMARAVTVFRDAALERERLERQAEEQRLLAEEQRQKADTERQKNEDERRRNAELQKQAAEEQARVIKLLAEGLQKLSAGELVFRLGEGFSDSYRKIKDDFNLMAEQMGGAMSEIKLLAHEVANSATEFSSATVDLSQRTEEQAASLEETTASMEEIAATVKKNAENAQVANQSASNTREVADRGGEVVAKAVGAMARIEESSRKISDIIGVIDEIARQTNLLALNAAVEAARAGEAGRGFAVVASEVRSLAQRSAQAAKDIKVLITDSNGQVKEGVDLVNQAGTTLNEIVESIKTVAEIVSDIATASAEQSTGIEQVNKALTQMDDVTQQNSALVEENAATAKTLENQAAQMNQRTSYFRVESDPAAGKPALLRAS